MSGAALLAGLAVAAGLTLIAFHGKKLLVVLLAGQQAFDDLERIRGADAPNRTALLAFVIARALVWMALGLWLISWGLGGLGLI